MLWAKQNITTSERNFLPMGKNLTCRLKEAHGGPPDWEGLPVFVSHYANYLSRFLLCVLCSHLRGQMGAGAETSSPGNIVFTSASSRCHPPAPLLLCPH